MTNAGALKSSNTLSCKTKQNSPCKILVFHANYLKNDVTLMNALIFLTFAKEMQGFSIRCPHLTDLPHLLWDRGCRKYKYLYRFFAHTNQDAKQNHRSTSYRCWV